MTITVDGLRTALDRLANARPSMRQPMQDSAIALALRLADERDALVTRLDKRWDWCDANEGHPQFIEREDAVIADLATYETMEDALRDAAGVLYGAAA